ncbi:MAG: hypothetical protein V4614_05170 [Pseudomonadota bacterium]
MKINTHGLALELSLADPLDEEDWCRVRVVAEVPSFQASLVAFLQGADLARFRSEIETMYANLGKAADATLVSVEPGVSISLSIGTLGGIVGTYKLQEEFVEGGAPTLTGGFQMDQSYLPSLMDGIDKLLAELGGT